jgi:hypothetical protein
MESTLEARLEATKTQDPRPDYRDLLRSLKDSDPDAFTRMRAHYAEHVESALARGDRDPLALWLDYGLALAHAVGGEGEPVVIGADGLSVPLDGSPPPGLLTLVLPGRGGLKAIAVAVPSQPSPAQQASLDLLVHGKVKSSSLDRAGA